jgi:hypothetical protein
MQKQLIVDGDDDLSHICSSIGLTSNAISLSQGNTIDPKVSIIRHKKEEHRQQRVAERKGSRIGRQIEDREDKKGGTKTQERSWSKSRDKKGGHPLLNYLSNRMEISSKGWNSIRPAKKERGQGGKRAPK